MLKEREKERERGEGREREKKKKEREETKITMIRCTGTTHNVFSVHISLLYLCLSLYDEVLWVLQ